MEEILNLLPDCNKQSPESGTRPIDKAIPFFLRVLQIITSIIKTKPNILEVGAGNGWNTKKLQNVSLHDWTVTDAQKHEPSYCLIDIIDANEAITKYKNEWNTLLMVSPTPNESWSLDAIKHAMTVNDHFFLIFFGEMGYSDGSPGTDLFLDNPDNGFKKLFMESYNDIEINFDYCDDMMSMMIQMMTMISSIRAPNKEFVYLYEFTKKP